MIKVNLEQIVREGFSTVAYQVRYALQDRKKFTNLAALEHTQIEG